MTLLLSRAEWEERRDLLRSPRGASLAALADSMERDLDLVMAHPLVIPEEKALLSRAGGRCPRDGSLLEFDPFEARRHRCGTCGEVFSGAEHDGFWRYWYHLWLAERAVHAAVLHRLREDPRHAELARRIIDGYTERYNAYPNADNTLGPSRVFFSTYLESIWLLQLCVAIDALEGAGAMPAGAGAHVRQQLVAPARELVAQYDEGFSNRQAWNVAACMAASRVLGEDAEVQRLVDAPSGLAALIRNGCLDDGGWYEGENYHMFAHRGLWYGVTIAERAGAVIPGDVKARFDAGFIAPFLTMLPDATLPSRRDSQYAISLRQPRFAEHCELGMARVDDARLAGVAAMLYYAPPGIPAGDNGRQRSSGDVERNLPAMRLQRSDLGWRSLLQARAALPIADAIPLRSEHLEGQGLAIFRRDAGRVYAALDYGETGGGHGHPDRLNLLLMDGDARWLDDMGTGSYVDRSLHWYRSTLAHNAPLVDGRSQQRVPGTLEAFDERGGAGWVRAQHATAPGVVVERALVVMPDYAIDDVQWRAGRVVMLDLPNHAPLRARGVDGWELARFQGGDGLEDGFDFVDEAHRVVMGAGAAVHLAGRVAGHVMGLDLRCDVPWELWRVTAPGAPGAGSHEFHVVRAHSGAGRITSVWSWASERIATSFADDRVLVRRPDGTAESHAHQARGWEIELHAGDAHSSISLGEGAGMRGRAPGSSDTEPRRAHAPAIPAPRALPMEVHLGEREYRRSEPSWTEAGAPRAVVRIAASADALHVAVRVVKRDPIVFVDEGQENPLDNEPAEINGDGVQLYVACEGMAGGWTIVPVRPGSRARGRPVRGWEGLALEQASWAALADGYAIDARVALPVGSAGRIAHVGVMVNETAPGRARRRGQLVLGGAGGEWVYLRGDRVDPAHLLAVRVPGDHLIF